MVMNDLAGAQTWIHLDICGPLIIFLDLGCFCKKELESQVELLNQEALQQSIY